MSRHLARAVAAAICVACSTFAGAFATDASAATGPDFVLGATNDSIVPGAPIRLGPGGVESATLDVDNVGDVDDTGVLTVTLSGYDIAAAEVSELGAAGVILACTTSGDVLTCPVPTLAAGLLADGAHDRRLELNVPVADAPAGSALTITATLTPDGVTDPTPADNTASLAGVVLPSADLRATLSPHDDVVLTAGVPTAFTLTVGNNGPDTAVDVSVGAVFQTNNPGFGVTSSDPRLTFTQERVFTNVSWHVGDLAVGARVSAVLTVTAASAGDTGYLLVRSSATGSGDPVPCYSVGCADDDSAQFTTVAAPVAQGPELAATGSHDAPLTVVGLGLVLVGAAVSWTARRRGHGRHRIA